MNSVNLKRQLQREHWITLIKESKESPMLLKDWLKENNVSKDQYYYWKRKISDECVSTVTSSFVEIPTEILDNQKLPAVKSNEPTPVIKPFYSSSIVASIRTNAICIDIYSDINPSLLNQLMEVIKNV